MQICNKTKRNMQQADMQIAHKMQGTHSTAHPPLTTAATSTKRDSLSCPMLHQAGRVQSHHHQAGDTEEGNRAGQALTTKPPRAR